MKRLPLVIALGAMLASLTGFTQQDADEHAAHHSEEQAAAPPSPPEHDHSQGGGKLQENMKKMQGLMVQIVETEARNYAANSSTNTCTSCAINLG